MTKHTKRSEASTITPITIQLTGFPSTEQAKEFLSAIIKPELQAHFMSVSMKLEAGVVTIAEDVCCVEKEFGLCDLSSGVCEMIGSGCPTKTE
jgi:hypothetical protein